MAFWMTVAARQTSSKHYPETRMTELDRMAFHCWNILSVSKSIMWILAWDGPLWCWRYYWYHVFQLRWCAWNHDEESHWTLYLPPLHAPLSTDRLAHLRPDSDEETISEITKARMNPRCEINCLQLIIWHRFWVPLWFWAPHPCQSLR